MIYLLVEPLLLWCVDEVSGRISRQGNPRPTYHHPWSDSMVRSTVLLAALAVQITKLWTAVLNEENVRTDTIQYWFSSARTFFLTSKEAIFEIYGTFLLVADIDCNLAEIVCENMETVYCGEWNV